MLHNAVQLEHKTRLKNKKNESNHTTAFANPVTCTKTQEFMYAHYYDVTSANAYWSWSMDVWSRDVWYKQATSAYTTGHADQHLEFRCCIFLFNWRRIAMQIWMTCLGGFAISFFNILRMRGATSRHLKLEAPVATHSEL